MNGFFLYALNAKKNSLQSLEFLFIKEVFLKQKPLMGSFDLMGFLVYVQDLYEDSFNQWQVEARRCV